MRFKQFINEEKIVYTGIFLSDKGKSELKKHYKGEHTNKFGHHTTLQFGAKVKDGMQGETVSLKVIGYAKSDEVEAIVIELPKGLTTKNKVPHITLTTANGIKPFASNALLEKGYEKIKPFTIEGTVGYFNGKKDVISELFITGDKFKPSWSAPKNYYELFKNPKPNEWKDVAKWDERRGIITPNGNVYALGLPDGETVVHDDIIRFMLERDLLKVNGYKSGGGGYFNTHFKDFFAIVDEGDGVWVPSESYDYRTEESRLDIEAWASKYMRKARKFNRTQKFNPRGSGGYVPPKGPWRNEV
jgi:hypothetical protein